MAVRKWLYLTTSVTGQAIKGNREEKTSYAEKKQNSEVPKEERLLKGKNVSNIEVKSNRVRPLGRPLDLKVNRSLVEFGLFGMKSSISQMA